MQNERQGGVSQSRVGGGSAAHGILRSALRAPQWRSAFSFTEVLFAVIILGIGFIMIAAIFPVAIQQTKTTTEETTGSTITRGAVNYLQTAALSVPGILPPTDDVVSLLPMPMWEQIRGNVILPEDPRYGWVAVYRRSGVPADPPSTWAAYAQIFVIPVESRLRSNLFVSNDILRSPTDVYPWNLNARATEVTLEFEGVGPGVSMVTFADSAATPGDETGAVGEGAYIIIADHATDPDLNNGRIYRVGNRISATEWELMPGSSMESAAEDGNAAAFIVGRGFVDPSATTPTYEGNVMDLGVYTTFVQVN